MRLYLSHPSKQWIVKNTNTEFVGLYGFDIVGFRETAYLFGGTYSGDKPYDRTKVWKLSEDAAQWTVYSQKMKDTGRLFFRSLVQANTIIHVGGIGNQKFEFWEWDEYFKDFKISGSFSIFVDVFHFFQIR